MRSHARSAPNVIAILTVRELILTSAICGMIQDGGDFHEPKFSQPLIPTCLFDFAHRSVPMEYPGTVSSRVGLADTLITVCDPISRRASAHVTCIAWGCARTHRWGRGVAMAAGRSGMAVPTHGKSSAVAGPLQR